MAAELVTPVDKLTGIPLPFVPNPDLPPVPLPHEPNVLRIGDWHHPNHPKASLVNVSLGKDALRHARVQWTSYEEHHHKYHTRYVGPVLPETETKQFVMTSLLVAGYIPRKGTAFDNREPYQRRMSVEERTYLRRSGQIKVESIPEVRKFLAHFVLAQPTDHIRETEIDEFLHTSDPHRRTYLAHSLIALAVQRATEHSELGKSYAYARSQDLLSPDLPAKPRDFVKRTITQKKLTHLLRMKFAEQAA